MAVASEKMLTAVGCATSQRCAAVGTTPKGTGISYESSNAGRTWRSTRVPSSSGPLEALACEPSGECVAVGAGTILVSQTSGASWHRVHDPVPSADLLAVSCVSPVTCVSAGMTQGVLSAPAAVVLRTTDAGATWTASPVLPAAQGLDALACEPSGECIAAGTGILVSYDSGASWHETFAPGGISSEIDAISCAGTSMCIAAAGASSLEARYLAIVDRATRSHWLQLPAPDTLRAISCRSPRSCVGVGRDVNSSRTQLVELSSAGSSALAELRPGYGLLDAIWCESGSGLCITAGGTRRGPEVLRSTDGGSTWDASRM